MKGRVQLPVLVGAVLVLLVVALTACGGAPPRQTNPPAPPAPTHAPTPAPELASADTLPEMGAAVKAVDLIAAWVEAGAPEEQAFDYTGMDGKSYRATFAVDVLPLFTKDGVWFDGSQSCSGCHFAASENSYHQMDLTSYQGVRVGADSLEEPPGVSVLGESAPNKGDFDWDHSKLRERLRNNRMPPGWKFDITEENRNGPCVSVSSQGAEVTLDKVGCEQSAVGLIGAWVEAGAPNGSFAYGGATLAFERDVLPFFTKNDMWFEGSQACTGCHFAASENSYHQMDLSSYAGILTGADSLEDPPGVSILGESAPGKGDFDWDHSKLRSRLRNNRMAPGVEFDITEENRNGPLILAGKK